MKKHKGMRPHDVVVLLKIVSKEKKQESWMMKNLSTELCLSASEISESLNRSVAAHLIAEDKKTVMKLSLIDFLHFGLPYVYPQKPGALVRGMNTAHSAEPMANEISFSEHFVWAYSEGEVRGQEIEPLYPNLPEACLKDSYLYRLMALCDVLRVGKAREKKIAIKLLKDLVC